MEVSGYERAWLQYIADIAYDRDGYHSAKDLGELVDELRSFAINALKGEPAPFPNEAVTVKSKSDDLKKALKELIDCLDASQPCAFNETYTSEAYEIARQFPDKLQAAKKVLTNF